MYSEIGLTGEDFPLEENEQIRNEIDTAAFELPMIFLFRYHSCLNYIGVNKDTYQISDFFWVPK